MPLSPANDSGDDSVSNRLKNIGTWKPRVSHLHKSHRGRRDAVTVVQQGERAPTKHDLFSLRSELSRCERQFTTIGSLLTFGTTVFPTVIFWFCDFVT